MFGIGINGAFFLVFGFLSEIITNTKMDDAEKNKDSLDTPRDVRLLHLLLASQSVLQYEDKVPLQLMDFAHRYTKGVLKDAIAYREYVGGSASDVSIEDIRLAIGARTQYQFKPTAPKELMLQLATERNKKPLPNVVSSWGVRLPPEKYCLTAKEWSIDE